MVPRTLFLPLLIALLCAGCYGPLDRGRGSDDDDCAAPSDDDDSSVDDDDETTDDDDDTDDDDVSDDDDTTDDDDVSDDDDSVPTDLDGDGFTEDDGDCDDSDPLTWPGAPELPDGVDNDCDGTVDEGTDWFDDDGDGFTEEDGDCDDDDALAYPGAGEILDGIDNDCDGDVDEETDAFDDDGDLWTEEDGDCDDTNAAINPGAPEDGGDGSNLGNGIDDDCDGLIDEGMLDYDDDGDGFTDVDGDCNDFDPLVYPGNVEDPTNGIDDDCDGDIDEVPICDCPTTSDLVEAADVCEGLVSDSLTGPSSGVLTSFGPYTVQGGCRMIALSTGIIGGSVQIGTDWGSSGSSGDTTTLTLTLAVPVWSASFSFDFNFMSAEYPEWVGSIYNDFFEVNLTSGAYTGNISFDAAGNPISINNAFFTVTSSAALTGTGFEGGVGGGTGWLTTTAPVIPGETITLQFSIGDVGDGIYDSTVLVDNFQWSVDAVGTPETQQ